MAGSSSIPRTGEATESRFVSSLNRANTLILTCVAPIGIGLAHPAAPHEHLFECEKVAEATSLQYTVMKQRVQFALTFFTVKNLLCGSH
jgi:hypothetical protein